MVAVSTIELPGCGLYRTTRPLTTDEVADEVGVGMLVNFHNHSDSGAPVVHLPAFTTFNRWQWEKRAHPVRQRAWLETLVPLPLEGYYVLRDDVRFEGAKWPPRSLVQLGYDRKGNGIVFLAQRRFHLAENTIYFGDRGIPIADDALRALEPLIVHQEPDPNAAGGEAAVAR